MDGWNEAIIHHIKKAVIRDCCCESMRILCSLSCLIDTRGKSSVNYDVIISSKSVCKGCVCVCVCVCVCSTESWLGFFCRKYFPTTTEAVMYSSNGISIATMHSTTCIHDVLNSHFFPVSLLILTTLVSRLSTMTLERRCFYTLLTGENSHHYQSYIYNNTLS